MPDRKIKTFPHQKIVKITHADYDENNVFMIINKVALFYAMRELRPLELKVFLYMGSNQVDYEFALSPQDISKRVGGSKRNIQDAINGLIEKGFLIQDEKQKNKYIYVQKTA